MMNITTIVSALGNDLIFIPLNVLKYFSLNLLEIKSSYISKSLSMAHNIQPLLNKTYLKATSAKGVYIFDENGKSYLDGSSGAVACSLGHSHERLIPQIKQQLDKLQFVYRSQFASGQWENL